MKLSHATVLEGLAEAMRDRIAPHVGDAFAGEALRMSQALVLIAGRAGEDAAAIRVEENAAMRAIFADAAPLADGDLAARLDAAVRSADPGLRISQLDAETGLLRTLLVELHSWVEGQQGEQFRRIDQAIWRAMRDAELARAPRA
jgi:hypothetical protein